MSKVFHSVVSFLSTQYRGMVAKKLSSYGLKYHDILIEFEHVNTALARTDSSILLERERRIKRAFDLSAKHKSLPPEHAEKEPLDFYLQNHMEYALQQKEERKVINHF